MPLTPLTPVADRVGPQVTSVPHPEAHAAGAIRHDGSGVPPPSASPFAEVVRALSHEADRGEATVRGVLAGGASQLGPAELLALQAGIYRYGETLDLAAKLVDKAGTDVRTVLQGQQ
jgi:hypothetical protein